MGKIRDLLLSLLDRREPEVDPERLCDWCRRQHALVGYRLCPECMADGRVQIM